MTRAEELELVRRCAEGDEDAWADFLAAYGAFLDYVVRRALVSARGGRLPSAHDVAELRGEVVAWLLEGDGRVLRTFRGESKLTSWLGVVVGRRARRLARRGQGLERRMVSLDALSAEAATHLACAGPDGGGGEREAALRKLADAVEALGERDRYLIRAAFFERRSYAEMAEAVGVRTDSVGQLLYRAKSRLKKRLGGEEFLRSLSGLLVGGLTWLLKG